MANSRRRQKRCRYCKELFSPDPRQDTARGNRQYACSKPSCQRARHQENHEKWLKRNPDAYQGRYPKTQLWLSRHPGYAEAYRRDHPEAVTRDNEGRKRRRQTAHILRADIQDAILQQPPVTKEIKASLTATGSADIQDSLWAQTVIISMVSARYLSRHCAGIQDAIDSPPLPPYRRAHDYQTSPYS
jgi:hypothetical protein